MNKEQQSLIDEAYIKYQNQTMFHTDDLVSLKELDGMHMSTGEKTKVYRQFAPKEFINKCKNDKDFSEKWGLKIEERELSYEERKKLCKLSDRVYPNNEWMKENNIPTQLITITYQDQTIESYEH
jgi:hypothetical protein